ncbi:hypothetical protein [Clostridium isatidis]|uniref:Uncharacterized protein n=1 Tax=Clostridium isatidis TaxID=182773 RepID=A0A343J9J4_9CLOT|nr:hypothetical protein [Clostridium isatidis]ASW42202.1 hypothetical protein BEN51_01455 [Clostridium isatidis]NLZ34477.1 hypothetical protein [Clostridiales bacterium]
MHISSNNSNKIDRHLVISIFLIFLFIFFLFIYFYNNNLNKNPLIVITKKLNTINEKVIKNFSNHTEDINLLNDSLVESVELLKNISEEIDVDKNNFFSQNKELQLLLNNSIAANIYLYDDLNYLLVNSKKVNSNYDLNKFLTLKENCINYYSILKKEYKLNLNFINKLNDYTDEYYNFLNKLIKNNRDTAFKEKQINKFLIKLENLNKEMDYLNEDLMPSINKIREEKDDLSIILDDLYKKEEKLVSIKNDLYSISIPEGYDELYVILNEYFNLYAAYLSSMKSAVIYEKSCSNFEDYSKEISKKYKNASLKREDTLEVYSKYLKLL